MKRSLPPWASWLWPLLIALALLVPFLAPCFGPAPSADQPAPSVTVTAVTGGTPLPTAAPTVTAYVYVSVPTRTPVPVWTLPPTETVTPTVYATVAPVPGVDYVLPTPTATLRPPFRPAAPVQAPPVQLPRRTP